MNKALEERSWTGVIGGLAEGMGTIGLQLGVLAGIAGGLSALSGGLTPLGLVMGGLGLMLGGWAAGCGAGFLVASTVKGLLDLGRAGAATTQAERGASWEDLGGDIALVALAGAFKGATALLGKVLGRIRRPAIDAEGTGVQELRAAEAAGKQASPASMMLTGLRQLKAHILLKLRTWKAHLEVRKVRRLVGTGAEGELLTNRATVTKLFRDHPNHEAIRAALAELDIQEMTARALPGENAQVGYIRVVGPEGQSFLRGRLAYDPAKAKVFDIGHEVGHVKDFRAGRMDPPYEVKAPDAKTFEAMKDPAQWSADKLIGRAKARLPAETLRADGQVLVDEIWNRLRDIKNLESKSSSGPPAKEVTQVIREREYSIRSFAERLDTLATSNPGLGEHLIRYIRERYPELPARFHGRMSEPLSSVLSFLR